MGKISFISCSVENRSRIIYKKAIFYISSIFCKMIGDNTGIKMNINYKLMMTLQEETFTYSEI
jgi:hypothetical protein